MREIRLYGSEGGGAEFNRLFLPLSGLGRRRAPTAPERCIYEIILSQFELHPQGILSLQAPLSNAPQESKCALASSGAAARNPLPETSAYCGEFVGIASRNPDEFLM
jgi:hypothetical protein